MRIADAAIIGGTGIGSRLANWDGKDIRLPSVYGEISGRICAWNNLKILVLQRHSSGHKVPPHQVNYRAMASALADAKIPVCLSSAAVGSLQVSWGPGTLAVCTDFIDLTFRRATIFDENVVHTDMSAPFPASKLIHQAAENLGHDVQRSATYVGLDGPRYETPAEIKMLQILGGDVVGMTASTEAILMRETGVQYGCLAVVTNLGCGLGQQELNHEEVVDVMNEKGQIVLDLLLESVRVFHL